MSKLIAINAHDTATCPHCKKEFEIQDALTSQLLDKYETEYESMLEEAKSQLREKVTAETQKSLAKQFEDQVSDLKEQLLESKAQEQKALEKIKIASQQAAENAKKEALENAENLQAELAAKNQSIERLRKTELELRHEKATLEEKQKELDLELQRQVDLVRKQILEESEESHRLKEAELRKQLEDVKKANDEMKRKLEQGSQQLQGEVLELEVEELLETSFPLDHIDPVKKGAHGADVIQTVKMRSGAVCGNIIWETKRAANWKNDWVHKLKADQQSVGGEIAVLVTTVFPSGLSSPMCLHEDIWLVRPDLVKPLAEALRGGLIEAYRQKAITKGRGESMETLYSYITSQQFVQQVRAILDTYDQMKNELEKEKKAMMSSWKRRLGHLDRLSTNVIGICGDLQGLPGEILPELEGISSFAELELLED